MPPSPGFAPDPSLAPEHRFALAVGAYHARRVGLGSTWLRGEPPGAGGRAWARQVLWCELGVATGDDLAPHLAAMTGWSSPGAHELSHAVYVAQIGACAGYLGAAEAWRWVIRAGRATFGLYRSWREVGAALRADRSRAPATLDERERLEQLLDPDNPASPWTQTPWPAQPRFDPPALVEDPPPVPPTVTPVRRFALALSAPLTLNLGWDPAWLACGAPGTGAEAAGFGMLAMDWSVSTTADVAAILSWLGGEGDRASWRIIATRLLQEANASQRSPIAIADGLAEPGARRLYGVVARHLADHPAIPAFDLVRVGIVVRAAVAAGLLSAADGWRWLEQTAQLTAATFDSWEAFGRNYAIGNDFFMARSGGEVPAIDVRGIEWLLSSPASPWRSTPWGVG